MGPFYHQVGYVSLLYTLLLLLYTLLPVEWSCVHAVSLCLDMAQPFSVVVFNCRHMFHKECLPSSGTVSTTGRRPP